MLGSTVGTISVNGNFSGYLISNTITNTNNAPLPTRIFHIHLVEGGSPGNIMIQNGQNGTTYINLTGTVSIGNDYDFGPWGILFPLGAYCITDSKVTEVSITCVEDTF